MLVLRSRLGIFIRRRSSEVCTVDNELVLMWEVYHYFLFCAVIKICCGLGVGARSRNGIRSDLMAWEVVSMRPVQNRNCA